MAKYIELEALLKFPIRADHCDKEHANEHFIYGIEAVMEYAEKLPAIEIVRCKDCRHHRDESAFTFCKKNVICCSNDPEYFCAYGERK